MTDREYLRDLLPNASDDDVDFFIERIRSCINDADVSESDARDRAVACLQRHYVSNGIRDFYLSRGRTVKQWHEVVRDPSKFNFVWNRALGLNGSDKPPPVEHRRRVPVVNRDIGQDCHVE